LKTIKQNEKEIDF